MGFEIVGFDDVFKDLDDMNISDQKKRRALRIGCDIVKSEIEEATPIRTSKMKESWKGTIKRFDGNLGFEIKGDTPQDIENEYGSSRNKKHVGFFSKAVDRVTDKAVNAIAREIFD